MARGLVLAPGFIDAHNHSDRGFTTDPSAASQVSQGITTVVIGQDGGSPFPVGEYLADLDQESHRAQCAHVSSATPPSDRV